MLSPIPLLLYAFVNTEHFFFNHSIVIVCFCLNQKAFFQSRVDASLKHVNKISHKSTVPKSVSATVQTNKMRLQSWSIYIIHKRKIQKAILLYKIRKVKYISKIVFFLSRSLIIPELSLEQRIYVKQWKEENLKVNSKEAYAWTPSTYLC